MTQSENSIKVIGLTGNTGSGKSSVASIMWECGGYIINADDIAHGVLASNKNAYTDILEYFGNGILDCNDSVSTSKGSINRKKLGELVFLDVNKKKRLEEIVHKYILEDIEEQIVKIKSEPGTYRFIVIDAPLLTETGLHKKTDEVWVVYAPDELRKSRIIARDSLTDEQARSRMASQTKFEKLCEFADEIIDNIGDHALLEQRVKQLIYRRI